MRNAGMKIRRIVLLNSKYVCAYCSWTQPSKIHCTSTTDLIKTVIHFTQASYLITMVRSIQRSDQNGDSLHKYSYLIKTVCSVQRLFSHSSAFFFSLNYRGRMSSKLFNAPSESSSMIELP